jgi:hypothetical protein
MKTLGYFTYFIHPAQPRKEAISFPTPNQQAGRVIFDHAPCQIPSDFAYWRSIRI